MSESTRTLEDLQEGLRKRIEELETEREQFIDRANARVGVYGSTIIELRAILEGKPIGDMARIVASELDVQTGPSDNGPDPKEPAPVQTNQPDTN
jgi:hypothetical protein